VVALIVMTLPTSNPVVFAGVGTGGHLRVELLSGYPHNNYDDNKQTWCYNVTVLATRGALSHWDLDLCDDPAHNFIWSNHPYETSDDQNWPGHGNLIKWNYSLDTGDSATFCFTLEGIYKQTMIEWLAKDGKHWTDTGTVTGPSCQVPTCPGIAIVKTADPTTVSEAGTVVTYDYEVTNPGEVLLTNVVVTDDNATPGDTSDDFNPTFTGGDTNGDGKLDLIETSTYTAQRTITQADIDAGDDIVNWATVTCAEEVTDEDMATVTITRRPPPPTTCSCCYQCGLTVDWEGWITSEPLYCSNDKLAVDLLGPSFDLSHNLFLVRGTHAPVVYKTTHYLIGVRELKEIPALPDNTEAIVVFNITPANAEFDRDIFLTLGIDELPENALNVTMAYYDDVNGVWALMESEAGGPSGVAELTLSAPINHFSIFGVLAELKPTPPPPPAHFVPSDLNIVPSVDRIWEPITFVTKTGESVTITANVANDGGQKGTYTVELKLNGQTVNTKTVTLGAGQSKQVSFTVSGLDYGQYEVEVAGLSDEFIASRTIAWWLIILLTVALGLIIWGVVWGRRRRKAQQEA